MIFERQDGPRPSWKLVFKYDPVMLFNDGSSGFLADSAQYRVPQILAMPEFNLYRQMLLVSLEHNPCIVFRIDTRTLNCRD